MGMFDTIYVMATCPYCKKSRCVEAQTKDLDKKLYLFRPLPFDWENQVFAKPFRENIPVYKEYPDDKSAGVWRNQAEKIEAQARVSPDFAHLTHIKIIASCPSTECINKWFMGKINIKNGYLLGGIYDIASNEKN